MERFAVIGAGSGGLAFSVDLTTRGFAVGLWDRDPAVIRKIRAAGNNVEYSGVLGDGAANVSLVSSNIMEVLSGAELVFVTVPAFAQAQVAKRLSSTKKEQLIVLAPGNFGSVEVGREISGNKKGPTIVEFSTLCFGCKRENPSKVAISAAVASRGHGIVRAGAYPASRGEFVAKRLEAIYDVRMVGTSLEAGLLNPNSVLHPPLALLNFANIEKTKYGLPAYDEGFTDSVLKCVESVEEEKRAVFEKLGYGYVSVDDQFKEFEVSPPYRQGVQVASQPKEFPKRYIDEDIFYGLNLMASFAKLLDVEVPVTESILRIISTITGKNYLRHGRRAEFLGITAQTISWLSKNLYDGTL